MNPAFSFPKILLLLAFGLTLPLCSLAQKKYNLTDSTGQKQGRWKEWHNNGQLKSQGRYANNLKKGSWKYYDEQGQLEKQEKYRHGELRWTFIYSNKRLIKIIDRKGRVTKKAACGC